MKKIQMIVIFLSLLLVLAGCGQAADGSENKVKEIRIGIQQSLSPLLLAKEKGWFEQSFEKEGVKVKWVEFQSGPPQFEGLAANQLDFSQVGNSPVIAGQAAEHLIRHLDQKTIEEAQKVLQGMDSVGQRRMVELHQGRKDKLEISPNLWAGIGLVRGGAGTALVGDPQTVADRIIEYQSLGIDTFIFSGYPHLEEAYYLAELVFPLLPFKRSGDTGLSVPAGEIIGNNHFPDAASAASSS